MAEAGCGLRVIVCGGRDYADRAALWRALDLLHVRAPLALVIHGGAGRRDRDGAVEYGADLLAGEWAWDRGVAYAQYLANWDTHGRAAGPMRNARMLEARPNGVVAFPRANGLVGEGTADMVRQAKAAGLRVWWPVKPRILTPA